MMKNDEIPKNIPRTVSSGLINTEFNIATFTQNVAIYLMNSVAEAIEYGYDDKKAMEYVNSQYNTLVDTMKKHDIGYLDLTNEDSWLLDTAKMMLICINNESITFDLLKDLFVSRREKMEQYITYEIEERTKEDLLNLGFAEWSEKDPILLVPIWAYRILPPDFELISINGAKRCPFDTKKDKEHPENDIRVDRPGLDINMGHMGWGIPIASLKN